jgi:hypothetical protein
VKQRALTNDLMPSRRSLNAHHIKFERQEIQLCGPYAVNFHEQ